MSSPNGSVARTTRCALNISSSSTFIRSCAAPVRFFMIVVIDHQSFFTPRHRAASRHIRNGQKSTDEMELCRFLRSIESIEVFTRPQMLASGHSLFHYAPYLLRQHRD